MIIGFITGINEYHGRNDPPFALDQKRQKLFEVDFLESGDELATPGHDGLFDSGNKGWRFGHSASLNCFVI